jgi:hypothetical protein
MITSRAAIIINWESINVRRGVINVNQIAIIIN